MADREAHHKGTFHVRSKRIRDAAYADPETRCWRCGFTLAERQAQFPLRDVVWTAGHLNDSEVEGELAAEDSVCNFGQGAKLAHGAVSGGNEPDPISVEGMSEREQAEEIYLELRRRGHGPIAAARGLHSSAAAINAYIALNPDFAQRVEEAIEESVEIVEQRAVQSAQLGDAQMMKLVLESHKPSEWLKPDRELMLKMQLPSELDITEFRQRLEAADARAKAIDVESREVEDGRSDN